jgi:ADP-ribose pyrophosphatase
MRVLKTTTLWEGDFIRTVLISYIDRRGVRREWEAVGRKDTAGVAIVVPLTAEGGVVLIRQYRPALDRYVIELPAGLVHEGEEFAEAARRELIEETGYDSNHIAPLTEGVISSGINTEPWVVFVAREAYAAPPDIRRKHPGDESEDIEVIALPLDGLYDRLALLADERTSIDLRVYGLVEAARRHPGRDSGRP